MLEPPDLSALAKRYVELWQDYLTAAAADPDLADGVARVIAAMGAAGAMSPWAVWQRGAAAWPGPLDRGGAAPAPDRQAAPQPATAGPAQRDAAAETRTTSAAAPPDERDDGLAELARRIARLDERLAALEGDVRRGFSERRPRARNPARRRRP